MGTILQEIAVSHKVDEKDIKMVDTLTENAPILRIMPFIASSDGVTHNVEELIAVTGGSWLDLDDPYPVVTNQTKLTPTSLSKIGGEVEGTKNKVANILGGNRTLEEKLEHYFGRKIPSDVKYTAQSVDNKLFNFFYNKAIGGTLNTNYFQAETVDGGNNNHAAIIAVRFEDDVCGAVYNSNIDTGDPIFRILNPDGDDPTAMHKNSSGQWVYSRIFEMDIGILAAGVNNRNVAALVNIKEGTIFEQKWIDRLLEAVRADNNNTFLIMHPRLMSDHLNQFVQDKMPVVVGGNIRTAGGNSGVPFTRWAGFTPFLPDYNAKLTVSSTSAYSFDFVS